MPALICLDYLCTFIYIKYRESDFRCGSIKLLGRLDTVWEIKNKKNTQCFQSKEGCIILELKFFNRKSAIYIYFYCQSVYKFKMLRYHYLNVLYVYI